MVTRALRPLEHWLLQYRHTWRATLITSFVTPPLYLAGLGLGLGRLVERSGGVVPPGTDYLAFVGSGLLAAAALQTAAIEGTHPVMAALRWHRAYRAMMHAPLGPTDVLVGHVAFMLLRIGLVCSVFLGYLAVFGVLQSPSALWALPVALLVGLACALPIVSYSVWAERDASLTVLLRFVVTPMFLFGGTFYPVDQAPPLLRAVAYVTPLWHGVELCRGIVVDESLPGTAALNLAVLAAWVVAGFLAGRHLYQRQLEQ